MRPWLRRGLIGLFGASILLGGFAAYSHGHGRHGWMDNMTPEEMAQAKTKLIDKVSSKLDLNADQKQRLGMLLDKVHAQHAALHGATDPRTQVRGLVAGPKFDRAAAQALVTEKTAAVQAKGPEVIAAFGDFYDSLNPAQQQKVRDFMAGHHGHHWMHHG
jgi:Spy/CpxP family protein refolding chaperone